MPLDDPLHRVLADLLAYQNWWQATSPAHDAEPINAAGVAMRKGDRYMFVRHAERGTWEFPGGMVEAGETPEQAAQREATEEAGAPDGLDLTPLSEIDHNGVHYSLFVAAVPDEYHPHLRDRELDDWLWTSPESPPGPLHPGLEGFIGSDEFKEGDHPRDDDGKFGSGGGGGSSAPAKSTPAKAAFKPLDRNSPPKHIAKLVIPPAWTDVKYNPDPNGHKLVTGRDALRSDKFPRGRPVAIYSGEHDAKKAAIKFAKVNELMKKFDAVHKQNEDARKKPETQEVADALALVMATGLRPGSTKDTGAQKQAYGATTLEGRHVRVSPNGHVKLCFTGKKGVDLQIPVTDPGIAKMLTERKAKAQGGRIFPGVSDQSLRDHAHDMDGGGFTTKDFRTHLGTKTAMSEVEAREAPTNPKEYKRAVREVAEVVAAKLGNTPVIALQSYVAPEVFTGWRDSANV